ncbi:MAG: T9SS type A sorting domain-containing protein [Brumimicrobium sp.]|nr:T9SS type A sorting domain-containing protein [Brumimicrobium sp.]
MIRTFTKCLFQITLALSVFFSYGQQAVNSLGVPLTIDFTGFDGSGFAPSPAAGQLNSNNWEIIGLSDGPLNFGGTGTTGDFARGTSVGGVLSGGIYSFDNSTGASLGFQGTGTDFTPGAITLAIQNNTGDVIEDLDISYEVWVFNDQGRSNSVNFAHSADNMTFTAEPSLDFATTEIADASPAWQSNTRTITLTNLNLAVGAVYYLSWASDDVSGAGARDEIALDNISITGLSSFPYISVNPITLSGFLQYVGTPSPEQTFEVSGSNLTNDIDLTISGDYEMSLTSGGIFTNTLTLTQTAGSVSPTTIYVRLNGPAAASPSNGQVNLTSTGATTKIVNLEGEILMPTPNIIVSTNSLTGFTHFTGTPSGEQTFQVSGDNLTADITLTAPTNFEISLTSGAGFTNSIALTPDGSGSVPLTDIYVRLNGPTANYNQSGDIVASSAGATDETVSLSGVTYDYTLYPIGAVTTNDANGVADSLNVFVELRGVVHCIDFNAGTGYSFTIIDSQGDGINVYSTTQLNGYVALEGDSLRVKGSIDQFNGLTQIAADSIHVFLQGQLTETPTVVTALDETTESQLVKLEGLSLVNAETTWPSNGNIDLTDGTNTYTARVTAASPLAGTPTPSGPFDMTGIGGQFDNSSPYFDGYQIFPCSVDELCNLDITTSVSGVTITANATGVTYQWVDCDDNYANIATETNQDFTPIQNGNYAVIISDGNCQDTSNCVNISTIGLTSNALNTIKMYPNPVNDLLTVQSLGNEIRTITVESVNGQRVVEVSVNNEKAVLNTINWESGIYFVNIHFVQGVSTLKLVKE